MINKKKVLVIDDEPDLVKIIKFRLENKGYKVEFAYDGEEGLTKTNEFHPDLIILDINMPKLDGLEFYRRLSTEYNHTIFPVLILTARGELRDLFSEIKADGFMSKPFEIDKLLEEIERILNKKGHTTIFIIDLESSMRVKEIESVLLKERYKVIITDNIKKFKMLIIENKPDFVFMEYIQSEQNGADVISKLKNIIKDLSENSREAACRVPIIVYSYSGLDYRDKSLAAGADIYMGKPKEYFEFLRVIENFNLNNKLKIL